MLTLSIAMFFKREVFALTTISVVWVIFGIVNFVILHFRVTPFSAVDFTLIKSAISVSSHYLNLFTIAMIIVAIFVVLIGLICLFRKAPVKSNMDIERSSFRFCVVLHLAWQLLSFIAQVIRCRHFPHIIQTFQRPMKITVLLIALQIVYWIPE